MKGQIAARDVADMEKSLSALFDALECMESHGQFLALLGGMSAAGVKTGNGSAGIHLGVAVLCASLCAGMDAAPHGDWTTQRNAALRAFNDTAKKALADLRAKVGA